MKLLQSQVAGILGVSEDSVCYWENNRTSPAIRFISRIIEFIGYLPSGDVSNLTAGERIVAYRRILGITQEELARRLGVDPRTLARWEKGNGTPPGRLLMR